MTHVDFSIFLRTYCIAMNASSSRDYVRSWLIEMFLRPSVVLKFFADFRILDFQIVIANPGKILSGTIRSTFSSAMTNLNIGNFYFNSNLFYNMFSPRENVTPLNRSKLFRQCHGVGSNQFLSVNIGVIRLLSVITTTPFGIYGTSETMLDQKKMEKDQVHR